MGFAHSWGIRKREKDLVFDCDEIGCDSDPECTMYRGITINASAEVIFRWLCQLRFSSCSYDLMRSSTKKTLQKTLFSQPALEKGQILMDIFEVVRFEINTKISLSIIPDTGYPLEELVASYLIVEAEGNGNRLLCKATMKYKESLFGRLAKRLLPWGDLIMIRKQFLNVKQLAERYKLQMNNKGNILELERS